LLVTYADLAPTYPDAPVLQTHWLLVDVADVVAVQPFAANVAPVSKPPSPEAEMIVVCDNKSPGNKKISAKPDDKDRFLKSD
jgi:hypothetical protein